MYYIQKLSEENWECSVTIQDGTECWMANSRQEAIYQVIAAARTFNGTYIREDDIEIISDVMYKDVMSVDQVMLQKIKNGNLVVLECTDYRIKYRITEEECNMIVDIREGKKKVI